MQIDRFKRKAMFWSGMLMLPTAGYLIYYTYEAMTRFISRSFTHPEFWENHWMIDKDVTLDLTTRTIYFISWMPVILVSCLTTIVGLYLLNRMRQGLFFDIGTAKTVLIMGGLSVLTTVLDTVMESVSVVLITVQNADGGWPLSYQYDPTDIKGLILDLVILTFGWMMREAILIDQEHKGYV